MLNYYDEEDRQDNLKSKKKKGRKQSNENSNKDLLFSLPFPKVGAPKPPEGFLENKEEECPLKN